MLPDAFGAPAAEQDEQMREQGFAAGAWAGHVVFYDALYVTGSAQKNRPFARDVLTGHQKACYSDGLECAARNQHRRGPGPRVAWPSNYDSPNPVTFLTVHPRA
jgi:CRISPR-associated protein Cmr6